MAGVFVLLLILLLLLLLLVLQLHYFFLSTGTNTKETGNRRIFGQSQEIGGHTKAPTNALTNIPQQIKSEKMDDAKNITAVGFYFFKQSAFRSKKSSEE